VIDALLSVDVPSLLAEPTRAADVAIEHLPAVLAALASHQARIAAVQTALAARLAALPAQTSTSIAHPYSLKEAAMLLGKSPTWVRRRARDGRLPGRKVGKSWVFPRDEFDRVCRRPRLAA
jgi:excisionase family DNA binding protein